MRQCPTAMGELATSPWTLFLDFDGVINNDAFLRHQRNHVAPGEQLLFDPINLAVLERLCGELPVAAIVVSSSWRLERSVDDLRNLFTQHAAGVAKLLAGATPSIGAGPAGRAAEILEYVRDHEVARWLALDDFALGPALGSQFFQTSAARGLTAAVADEILAALRRPPLVSGD